MTAIEFISPGNKIGVRNRDAYRKKRRKLLQGHVSLVEIDLVREGKPHLAVPIKGIPANLRTDYGVCVVCGWKRLLAKVYHVPLRSALPNIAIPLRRTDAEIVLQLQPLIDMVYENGHTGCVAIRKSPSRL